jgi:DNA-binding GntR family transcriptional regulator
MTAQNAATPSPGNGSDLGPDPADAGTVPADAGSAAAEETLRPQLPRLDPTRPAGSQIFQALKSAILRMELPPGCTLSETELGTRFGASRTPVREALAQLRDAGLVTTLPSRGNFVTRLNEEKIREARFLREALEVANVSHLAAHGLTPEAAAEIEATLAAQAAAIEAGDDMAFQLADDAFHLALARATGYPRAAHVLEHEKMQLDRLRVLSLRDRAHLGELLHEHRAIVAAIRNRDGPRAVAGTLKHLRSILGVLSTLVERHADYFDRPASGGPATA